jgi:aspartyl-tRNA(Asn)/glutamyl-tRNA(Gln) amidotransferase subunit C
VIDRERVRQVARLARLELSAAEEERFAAQLGHVLEHIERLQAVDVSGVDPLAFAGDVDAKQAEALLRADEPREGLPHERALDGAPEHDGQAFLVPRILE